MSSRHLHDTVRVGDLIQVTAPAGRFTFDGSAADSIVMIAGGVGITPLMSKLRCLTDRGWPGEVYFVFSGRTERDIIFREELDYLAKRHPNLHVVATLTNPAPDWKGERGRVSAELLGRVVPDLATRLVHICGPTAMADAMNALLVGLGIPADRIEVESFTSPKASPSGVASASPSPKGAGVGPSDRSRANDDAPGDVHAVTFAKSDKTVDVPSDQVLLEAAKTAGVSIDFDCRSGICGQCKTKLLTGMVTMEVEEALSVMDRADGLILACQARCVDDVTVDA